MTMTAAVTDIYQHGERRLLRKARAHLIEAARLLIAAGHLELYAEVARLHDAASIALAGAEQEVVDHGR